MAPGHPTMSGYYLVSPRFLHADLEVGHPKGTKVWDERPFEPNWRTLPLAGARQRAEDVEPLLPVLKVLGRG